MNRFTKVRQIFAFAATIALCAGLVVIGTQRAGATGSQSQTITVNAGVSGNCKTVNWGTTTISGTYDPITDTSATTLYSGGTYSFNITCTKKAKVYVDVTNGAHAVGTGTQKQPTMVGTSPNTDVLNYAFYSAAPTTIGASTIFGSTSTDGTDNGPTTSPAGQLITGAGPGSPPNIINLYVGIPGAQDVQPDTYTDTASVSLNY